MTGGLIGALIGAADSVATKTVEERARYKAALEHDGFLIAVETTTDNLAFVVGVMEEAGAGDVSVLTEAES